MPELPLVVAAVVVATAVAGVSRRMGWPAPLLLIAVGAAGSYLPGVPTAPLDPEVVLYGLLPPLLYAAALRTSLVDIRRNRDAVVLLSVGAVGFTTVAVGLVAWWVVPAVSLAAAMALGAVVAPPDAVAATAVAHRVGMPRRLVSILEGESLVNDATALVALNTTIAAIAGTVTPLRVAGSFVLAAAGGVLIGLGVAVTLAWIRRHVTDTVLDTAISLIAPYVAFLLGEQVHSSGVLAVVVTGVMLGHRAPVVETAASRIAEFTYWRTITFVLENLVFLLIGLQARGILQRIGGDRLPLADVVLGCVAVLAATILARAVWVFGCAGVYRLLRAERAWGARVSLVVSWSGMRGVVTLAAAMLLPVQTPHRAVLQLIAFVVVAGTLGIHGLSLPWLVRRLRLPGPDPAEDALQAAGLVTEASRAGLRALDEAARPSDPPEVLDQLRARAERRTNAAWERLGRPAAEIEPPTAAYTRLRLQMLAAERTTILRARESGDVDDEVLRAALFQVDMEESQLDRAEDAQARLDAELAAPRYRPEDCAHLRAAPRVVPALTPGVCADCLAEGTTWVHLRLCLTCGHVGCCDSSVGRHATRHFHASDHPVMRSLEPGEAWRWCYVDEQLG